MVAARLKQWLTPALPVMAPEPQHGEEELSGAVGKVVEEWLEPQQRQQLRTSLGVFVKLKGNAQWRSDYCENVLAMPITGRTVSPHPAAG